MRRRGGFCAVIAASVVLLGALTTAVPSYARGGTELLPDLETREPTNLVFETVAGEKRLRFANTVGNHGVGVLEVENERGGDCDGDGDAENNRMAFQRLYRDGNSNGRFDRGVDPQSRRNVAGCMQFHPTHAHWHFDGFADYSLYNITSAGTRGALVGSNRKTSFCIADFGGRLWPELPGSPAQSYYTACTQTSIQGLSVGWSDTYTNFTDGQHVVLPNTHRGQYCLVSTADPDNRIVESDESDNVESVWVTVNGNWVSALPGTNC